MTLKILSGGAADGLVSAVADQLREATGSDISGDFGAVGGMRDRVLAGEAVDVVILTSAIIDVLAGSGHVNPESVRDIGRVPTGIAVRTADSEPDVRSAKSLAEALLSADSIYMPDPEKATAGIHFAKVMSELGVIDDVRDRIKSFPSGQVAMAAMAQATSERPLGCTQVTEIMNTPGVKLIGELPPGHELVTIYTAAVSSNATQPETAAKLIEILTASENAAVRRQKGLLEAE